METLNADGLTLVVVTHDPQIGDRARRRCAARWAGGGGCQDRGWRPPTSGHDVHRLQPRGVRRARALPAAHGDDAARDRHRRRGGAGADLARRGGAPLRHRGVPVPRHESAGRAARQDRDHAAWARGSWRARRRATSRSTTRARSCAARRSRRSRRSSSAPPRCLSTACERDITIMGATASLVEVRHWKVGDGRVPAATRTGTGPPPSASSATPSARSCFADQAARRPVAARRRAPLPRHRRAGQAGHVGDGQRGRARHPAGGLGAAAAQRCRAVPDPRPGRGPRVDAARQARRHRDPQGAAPRPGGRHRHHPGFGAVHLRRHLRRADRGAGGHRLRSAWSSPAC